MRQAILRTIHSLHLPVDPVARVRTLQWMAEGAADRNNSIGVM
jgi:hypothetical protein